VTLSFWKTTGGIKPFNSIEEFEKYTEELCKLPKLDSFINSPLKKSIVKRGINVRSEKFDSFAEFTFCQYMRLIKGYVVERNKKVTFFTYVDNNGKICKFYPDFIVNGQPMEVKGRLNEKDNEKLRQCELVQWYFQSDINEMRNELNQLFPDWQSEFIRLN